MTAALTPDRRAVLRRRVRLLGGCDDLLQRGGGDRRADRGDDRLVGCADRVRAGLGDRGQFGRGGGVAVRRSRIRERRERTALRVIAWSFFALAAYVAVEAVRALLGGGEAERSTVGIVLGGGQRRGDAVPVVGRNVGPGGSWARPARSRTPSRRCCARICRRRCWSDWCSTPRSAGGGPTRWRRWCWPRWLSKKAGRRGAETCAAHRRRELVRRRPGAPTAAARDQDGVSGLPPA